MTTMEPIFCKQSDIASGGDPLRSLEMCDSMAEVVGGRMVEGAQLINGIWRLYLKNREAKVDLLIKGLSVRGRKVTLYEQSPRFNNTENPDIKLEKIWIKDIPLSVDNKAIEQYFEGHAQVKLTTEVLYSKERRPDSGHLTNYKNGDRFVFAVHPIYPVLPHKDKVAGFYARIQHQSQRDLCKACDHSGHSAKDSECPAYDPELNIIAFSGHQHPLSNFYPCEDGIELYDEIFDTAEAAFQWRKAVDVGMDDLAEDIKNARHAGAAKAIARDNIPKNRSDRWNTEKGDDVMKEIIEAKANQCISFRNALLETDDAVLVEATADKYWACGLTKGLATCTKQNYWKGQNMLGAILMEEREALKYVTTSHHSHQSLTGYFPAAGDDDEDAELGKIKDPFEESFSEKDEDNHTGSKPKVDLFDTDNEEEDESTLKEETTIVDVNERTEEMCENQNQVQHNDTISDDIDSIPCNQEGDMQRESRSTLRKTSSERTLSSSKSRSQSNGSRGSTSKAAKQDQGKQSKMDLFISKITGKRKSSISPVNSKSSKQHKTKDDAQPP